MRVFTPNARRREDAQQRAAQQRVSMHIGSVIDAVLAVLMDKLGGFDQWRAMLATPADHLVDWPYQAKRAASCNEGDDG